MGRRIHYYFFYIGVIFERRVKGLLKLYIILFNRGMKIKLSVTTITVIGG